MLQYTAAKPTKGNHMEKMFEAPEFFYYAIADGLRWLIVCHGRWRGLDCVREQQGDLQMEFELLSGCWLSGKL